MMLSSSLNSRLGLLMVAVAAAAILVYVRTVMIAVVTLGYVTRVCMG